MFEVTVKRSFKVKHAVVNERPHEHDWTVEVTLGSAHLDEAGFVMDFQMIDRALDEIITPAWSFEGSSAEKIAQFFHDKLSAVLTKEKTRILSVTAWEDHNHGATFRP